MTRAKGAAVAASGSWIDPDEGIRAPAGEVHAWSPGANQTLCGLALSKAGLLRFPHIAWPEVQPESGGSADRVRRVCPRCAAAMGRRSRSRPWRGVAPRP